MVQLDFGQDFVDLIFDRFHVIVLNLLKEPKLVSQPIDFIFLLFVVNVRKVLQADD